MTDNAEFLEWLAAADVLKIRDGERRDAGWPCEFDLVSIASLQYPDTPTSGARERREQRQARDRLIEAMKASVAAGSLKAETRRKEIKKAAFHSPQPSAGLGSAAWLSRDFDRQDEQRAAHARRAAQSNVTIVADEVVTREAFAAWGGLSDQKQSELIRAWLRTTEHEPNALASLTPMKRMAIIASLERHYPSLAADFNRAEAWIKACSTGEHGEYYMEKIKEGCAKKWGELAPVVQLGAVRSHKMAR